MPDWMQDHEALLWWAFAGSIVMFVGGLLFVPWLIVRMPQDFFLRHDRPPKYRHPVLHVLLVIARNVVGWLLLIAGIAMLVLPGQGLLTMLVALALMDFPGKRGFELAIMRRGPIRRTIDWLRRRNGRPPLIFPVRKRGEPPAEPGDERESAASRAYDAEPKSSQRP